VVPDPPEEPQLLINEKLKAVMMRPNVVVKPEVFIKASNPLLASFRPVELEI
jgi:hypothetical protein